MEEININNLKQSIYKDSFFDFVKEFWHVVSTEELVLNWHIEYLCNELQFVAERVLKREKKLYDLVINIPPGMSKTSVISILFNAWIWTKDPTISVISSSHGMSLSTDNAVKTRDVLRSEKYQNYFPFIQAKEDSDNKTNFKNTQGGQRIATSPGSKITGRHAHLILVDDPEDPSTVLSKAKREVVKRHLTKALPSRTVNKEVAVTILVMQRLNENDSTALLLSKKKKVRHICLPAKLSKKVSPPILKKKYKNGFLDPNRLNQAVLDDAKEDLGSSEYSSQYMQNPSSSKGNIIKEYYFEYFRPTAELIKQPRHFYSDTAYGKENSDDSATLCYSFYKGDIYVWDLMKVNLKFNEFNKAYVDFIFKNRYSDKSVCRFEPKASGDSIVQSLKGTKIKGIYLNIKADKPPKDNKETRVKAILGKLETGRYKLLANQTWNEILIDQAKSFPNGENDDIVDVISAIGKLHLLGKKGSFKLRTN